MAREIVSRAPLKDPEGSGNVAAVILVHLTHNRDTPYVTWIEGKDGSTFWGNYHTFYSEAEPDFKQRCETYKTETPIINPVALATPMEKDPNDDQA